MIYYVDNVLQLIPFVDIVACVFEEIEIQILGDKKDTRGNVEIYSGR